MRSWWFAVVAAIAAASFVIGLDPVLWDPVETVIAEAVAGDSLVLSPLDTAASTAGLAVFGETPLGARAGHLVLGLCAVVAIWLASRSRRGGMFAVAALLGSPAIVLAGRSAAPGIAGLAPIAIATLGIIEYREHGQRRTLIVVAAGGALVGFALGLVGVVAMLAIACTLATRRGVIAGIVLAASGAGTVTLGLLAGTSLWPSGGNTPTRAFAEALGNVGLGMFPLVLGALVGLVLGDVRSPRARGWLASAAIWLGATMLWPDDPYLALAPAVPLALLAGDALDRIIERDEPAPALACVIAIATIVVARSFDLEPARLVSAHVRASADAGQVTFGWPGLACAAGFGALAVALAVQRHRTALIAIGLAAAAGLTLDTAIRRVAEASAAASVQGLIARADRHAVAVTAGVGLAGHAIAFGDGRVPEVSVDQLAAQLATGGCRGALIAQAQLPALERQARGRYGVIGEAVSGLRLVSSCLPAGVTDANPFSGTLLAALPTPLPGKPVRATWGNAIRIHAAEVPERVTLGAVDIPITLVFEVIGKPPPGRVSVPLRLVGSSTIYGDHFPIDGNLPVAAMLPGDVIVDRTKVRLPPETKPGRYVVMVGFGTRLKREPIEPLTDETDRLKLGTITVEAAR